MEIKTMSNYIPILMEEFPELSKQELEVLVKTALQNLSQYIRKGCTFQLSSKDKNFSIVIGTTPKDGDSFYKEYVKKLKTTLKILFQKKQTSWDNTYYFASSKKLNNTDSITLKNISISKSIDWIKSQTTKKIHIYKFNSNQDIGFNKFFKILNIKEIEYVKSIPSKKFSDLMVTNASYQTIKKTYNNGTRNFKYLLGRISDGLKPNADS